MVEIMKGRTKNYDRGDFTPPVDLTTEDLIAALFDVEDTLERASCPFVLLDETARQARNNRESLHPILQLNEITVGVMERHLADTTRQMLRTIKPEAEWLPTSISYNYGSVPIVIYRIKNRHPVFESPDSIWFYTTQLHIPNPFRTYWNNRHNILT